MKGLSDTDPAASAPPPQFRSPLLWILLPLVAGYGAGQAIPEAHPLLLLGLALVPALAGIALVQRAPQSQMYWRASLTTGLFLASWAWWVISVPPAPADWQRLPPREADVVLKVESAFTPSMDGRYWRGVGRITEAGPLMHELTGQRLLFSTRAPDRAEPLSAGRELPLRGVISRLESDEEDGFLTHWQSQGVAFRLRQGQLLSPPPPPSRLALWTQGWQAHWKNLLTRAPPSQASRAHILAAMLLGDRTILDDAQKEGFLLSGTKHLFAVSGLHVVAVGGTLLGLFTLFRLPPKLRGPLSLLLLGCYVVVIGAPPSAVRAYVMLVFYGLGRALGRQTAPFPAIVASAVALLLWDPRQIVTLGFQLSYAVVFSILLLGLPLGDALDARLRSTDPLALPRAGLWQPALDRFRRNALQAVAVSLVASLASSPLILRHFEVFTPGAILLNPVLVPLAGLVVVAGVVVLLTGLLHLGFVSLFFAHGAWLLISCMEAAVNTSLRLPGLFHRRTWSPGDWAGVLTLVFLLLALTAHHHTLSRRWSPLLRYGIPLITLLTGLLIGTRVQ